MPPSGCSGLLLVSGPTARRLGQPPPDQTLKLVIQNPNEVPVVIQGMNTTQIGPICGGSGATGAVQDHAGLALGVVDVLAVQSTAGAAGWLAAPMQPQIAAYRPQWGS